MSSRADLESSTLKDLLKICRSHALDLPYELPEDKHYYVDLILRHRQAVREAQGEEGQVHEHQSEGETANSVSSATSFLSGLIGGRSAPDAGDSTHDGSSSMPGTADSGDEGSMSEGYVRVSGEAAAALMGESEGKDADAAAEAALMHDIEYDDEEEEFARSPAVQKITLFLQNIAVFDWLERHTSIPRFYWLVVIVLTLSVSIFVWIGVLAVCDFICFVYPAYRTFKTLEGKFLPGHHSADEENQSIEVHRYWLTYWVVYGLFRVFEFLADYTLYWLPYYHVAKVLFLVWCFHPSTAGCAIVYEWVIRPLFLPREEQIDQAIYRMHTGFSQALGEVKSVIVKQVARRIAGGDDTPAKQPPEKKAR